VSPIAWDHATRDDTHPVEPRYAATKWVCYVCREPVNDGGRAINMAALPSLDVFAAPRTTDADQPGLQVEGS
jgi:hypothetical protein